MQGQISFCNSDELCAPKSGNRSTWEYVRPAGPGTPYYYQPEKPSIWCLHPAATKDERREISPFLIQPSHHYFTFNATFCISTTHEGFGLGPVASCTLDAHTLCPISILGNDGLTAGTIYLPFHQGPICPPQRMISRIFQHMPRSTR